MKKVLVLAALVALSSPPSFAQAHMTVGSAPANGNAGFAPPNAYGYTGSYTGGAGYSNNFGFNTMRPGNMPLQYGYGVTPYGMPYGSPAFGLPQPYGIAGGGFYTMSYGGRNVRYWQSPSGYYYPWLNSYSTPIVYVPQAGQNPQASSPPISTICADLLTYLDQQREKGNVSEDAYQHLKRRTLDIRNKERDLRISGNGTVDSQDEVYIRRDLEGLGGEVAKSIAP